MEGCELDEPVRENFLNHRTLKNYSTNHPDKQMNQPSDCLSGHLATAELRPFMPLNPPSVSH